MADADHDQDLSEKQEEPLEQNEVINNSEDASDKQESNEKENIANKSIEGAAINGTDKSQKIMKKTMIIIAVIIAVVIIGIAAAVIGTNIHNQQLAAQEQAAQDAVGEQQVMEFFQQQSDVLAPDENSSTYIGKQEFTLDSVTINSKQKDEESGKLIITASAHLTSEALARDVDATLIFEKQGDSYELTDESVIENTSIMATKGISTDVKDDAYGMLDVTGMDLQFDQGAQTCSYSKSVSEEQWYGSYSGTITYNFQFTDGKWQKLDSTQDLNVKSLKGLIGSYKDRRKGNNDAGSLDAHGYFNSFKIESVDMREHTVKVSFDWMGPQSSMMLGLMSYSPKSYGTVNARFVIGPNGALQLQFNPYGGATKDALKGTAIVTNNKGEIEIGKLHVLYVANGQNLETKDNELSLILYKESDKDSKKK